jgi:hypothetical protein
VYVLQHQYCWVYLLSDDINIGKQLCEAFKLSGTTEDRHTFEVIRTRGIYCDEVVVDGKKVVDD